MRSFPSFRFLPPLLLVGLGGLGGIVGLGGLGGCSAPSVDEDTGAAEHHDTVAEPTVKTPIASDFGHDDVVLGAEPMARLIVPNANATPRCGSGVPVIGANEAGRLLVDGNKLTVMAPGFTEDEHDTFQLECLSDMPFEVLTGAAAAVRPTPEQLLLVLDLFPTTEPESLRLDVVDANDKPLFTADDLATFVEQVQTQTSSSSSAAAMDPYSETLRQEEILDRVLASSPATYIARQYTSTTTERWGFADGHCEIVTTKDINVTLLSPSHFGIELDLSRLAKHSESHDTACQITR